MSYQVWLTYVLACWVISLSPGAGAIASMSSGLNYGFRRGYWNAIGLQLALLLQIAVVAAGVGVLLASVPWAFFVVKWFGVAYLFYLAYLQWNAPIQSVQVSQAQQAEVSIAKLIMHGFLVNMSNPKALVFLLAVLPQFLDHSQPQGMQYLLMAITMVSIDLIVMAGYTGLAAKVLRLLRSAKQQKYLNRSFALLFAAAASVLTLV